MAALNCLSETVAALKQLRAEVTAVEVVSAPWTRSRQPAEAIPALWHRTSLCWEHPSEDSQKAAASLGEGVPLPRFSLGKCVIQPASISMCTWLKQWRCWKRWTFRFFRKQMTLVCLKLTTFPIKDCLCNKKKHWVLARSTNQLSHSRNNVTNVSLRLSKVPL